MMNRKLLAAAVLTMIVLTGCGDSGTTGGNETDLNTGITDGNMETADEALEELPNLAIRFGETSDLPVYEIQLEDNEVSLQFVRVLQRSEQTIPIYVFDGSENTDVMQYYDVPDSYDIPDGEPVNVESESAGDVYYSAPSRIMIFYRDAEVPGDYVKVGTVTSTEGLEDAVDSNPLDSWGNKRVMLSIAE